MALCGIIEHHDKNEKPCVLGFWHFLTSESIAGLSASLSAHSPVNRKIYGTFSFVFLSSPPSPSENGCLGCIIDGRTATMTPPKPL